MATTSIQDIGFPKALGSSDAKLREALALHGLLTALPTDTLWNSEKFLGGRDRQVLCHFAPDITPETPVLLSAIESALSECLPGSRLHRQSGIEGTRWIMKWADKIHRRLV